jgi:hypothetical protein
LLLVLRAAASAGLRRGLKGKKGGLIRGSY